MSAVNNYPTESVEKKGEYNVDGLEAGNESDGGLSFTALIEEGKKETSIRPNNLLTLILDHSHDIKLRTMSWQKAAWLLAGDQVCLAIMAQTWSLS